MWVYTCTYFLIGKWFRMPKGKTTNDVNEGERLIVSEPSLRRLGSGYNADRTPTFYHQSFNPFCVRYCLASAFSFKGFTIAERLMINVSSSNLIDYSLIKTVQYLQKQGGVSKHVDMFVCICIYHYTYFYIYTQVGQRSQERKISILSKSQTQTR